MGRSANKTIRDDVAGSLDCTAEAIGVDAEHHKTSRNQRAHSVVTFATAGVTETGIKLFRDGLVRGVRVRC